MSPGPLEMLDTGTVADIADDELLRRAVAHVVRNKKRREVAWAAVSDTFSLGSTYSAQLCRRFGFDAETGKAQHPTKDHP